LTGAKNILKSLDCQSSLSGTHLRLTYAGFANKESRDKHEQAWRKVLEQTDNTFSAAR
jgi:hypothetical protein